MKHKKYGKDKGKGNVSLLN